MNWTEIFGLLTGPVGGMIAFGVGFGFVAGVAFMERFCSRRVDALIAQIDGLKIEVGELKTLVQQKDRELVRALERAASYGDLERAAKLLGQSKAFRAED